MTPPFRQAVVRAILVAAAGALLLAGCESKAPVSESNQPGVGEKPRYPGFARFDDLPTPQGAAMDIEHSLVLGERDVWVGRLVMTVGLGVGAVYDFYAAEMPRFQWSPITSVRSDVSILSFSRNGRVATIQIRPRTLGGAAISLTMSPRGVPDVAPASGSVSTTPLR